MRPSTGHRRASRDCSAPARVDGDRHQTAVSGRRVRIDVRYCTQVLHLAEGAAYNRIEAARAARGYPLILELFGQGAITLTAVRLLAPHLTAENHVAVLRSATHKSKREIESSCAQ